MGGGRTWKVAGLISLFALVVFYIEVLSGLLKRGQWAEFKDSSGRNFKVPDIENDEFLRILLVADPQLIGEDNEKHFIGPFSRWDSDRYLKKYYALAKNHVQPHIVAFLGDLFDEGSQAHDSQYRRYHQRFQDIFQLPRMSDPSNIEYIFLPGDNDVGGEDLPVNPIKLNWFNLTFGDFEKPYWLKTGNWNIQFLKMWNMEFSTHEAHQNFLKKIADISKDNYDGFRIILSHLPYWKYSSTTFRQMVSDLKPALILSGNDHRSSLITFTENSSQYQRTTNFLLSPNTSTTFHRINIHRTSESLALSEISVLTCSYRMGVADMGFGALRLFKNGTMDYTVLSLPSRFTQLAIYLGIYIFWKLILTPWIMWKICCLGLKKYRHWGKQEKSNKHIV